MALITDIHNILIDMHTGRMVYGDGIRELDRILRTTGQDWSSQFGQEIQKKADWIRRRSMSEDERKELGKLFARQEAHWAKIAGKIEPDIRRIVRAGIKGSKTDKELRNEIAAIEGRLRAYADTIVVTSRASFNNYVSVRESIAAGVKKFRLMGPPAEREWCADHLDKEYTLDEIKQMDNGQGLPVLYNCGGWRCRHAWVAVVEESDFKSPKLKPPKPTKPQAYSYDLPNLPTCTKQEFTDSWKRYDPDDIKFANKMLGKNYMTREQFIKLFTGDDLYTDELGARFRYYSGNGGMASFEYRNNNVIITRLFKLRDKEVDHAYFKISPAYQGNSEYKSIFLNQLALYKQMGLKRIEIHADIDVGCWCWGKYGFKLKDIYSDSIRKLADQFGTTPVGVRIHFTRDRYYFECIRDFCKDNNVKLEDFKNFVTDKNVNVDWYGYIDLTDNDQLEQAIHYAKGWGWKEKQP